MVDQKTIVQRASDDLYTTSLGNEQVILDPNRGEYFGLNSVGTFLFSLLEKPVPVHELVDVVMEKYGIDRQTALTDTRAFLEEMVRLGLVTTRA